MTEITGPVLPNIADLGRIVGRLRRALRRRLGSDPLLPDSHIEIVRLLYEHPGLKVQEVASALKLAPNTVSTLVQQLSRARRIERRTDPDDRRVARLHLTSTMRNRVARRRDERRAVLEEAFDSLPARDRSAVRAALPALVRLAEVLEESS